ncbi:hypothetical protein [Streptomyces sp. NPDC002403]
MSDPNITDLKDAAILATSNSNVSTPRVHGHPTSYCGMDPNIITVLSYDTRGNGAYADTVFTVAVL